MLLLRYNLHSNQATSTAKSLVVDSLEATFSFSLRRHSILEATLACWKQ
jgi:hypothetical protein